MCNQLLWVRSKHIVWHVLYIFFIGYWYNLKSKYIFTNNFWWRFKIKNHSLEPQRSPFWFSSEQHAIKDAHLSSILRFSYSCWLRKDNIFDCILGSPEGYCSSDSCSEDFMGAVIAINSIYHKPIGSGHRCAQFCTIRFR